MSVRSCVGGFSPSTAEVLTSSGGRSVFVKAVRASDNPSSPVLNRFEANALSGIPRGAPAPALLDAFDDGPWFVMVTEVGAGELPTVPWHRDDLDAVLAALHTLQATSTPCPVPGLRSISDVLGPDLQGFDRVAADPPDDLDPWLSARLPALRTASARGILALDGDTLCHTDLRADNVLVTADGRVTFVDWAWACRGSRFADALQLLASVEDPTGELDVSGRIDGLLDRVGEHRATGTDVLAGILGFFVDAARRPDHGLPGLTEHRLRSRDVLMPLVRGRWADGER